MASLLEGVVRHYFGRLWNNLRQRGRCIGQIAVRCLMISCLTAGRVGCGGGM
jgi:hypothetical protein